MIKLEENGTHLLNLTITLSNCDDVDKVVREDGRVLEVIGGDCCNYTNITIRAGKDGEKPERLSIAVVTEILKKIERGTVALPTLRFAGNYSFKPGNDDDWAAFERVFQIKFVQKLAVFTNFAQMSIGNARFISAIMRVARVLPRLEQLTIGPSYFMTLLAYNNNNNSIGGLPDNQIKMLLPNFQTFGWVNDHCFVKLRGPYARYHDVSITFQGTFPYSSPANEMWGPTEQDIFHLLSANTVNLEFLGGGQGMSIHIINDLLDEFQDATQLVLSGTKSVTGTTQDWHRFEKTVARFHKLESLELNLDLQVPRSTQTYVAFQNALRAVSNLPQLTKIELGKKFWVRNHNLNELLPLKNSVLAQKTVVLELESRFGVLPSAWESVKVGEGCHLLIKLDIASGAEHWSQVDERQLDESQTLASIYLQTVGEKVMRVLSSKNAPAKLSLRTDVPLTSSVLKGLCNSHVQSFDCTVVQMARGLGIAMPRLKNLATRLSFLTDGDLNEVKEQLERNFTLEEFKWNEEGESNLRKDVHLFQSCALLNKAGRESLVNPTPTSRGGQTEDWFSALAKVSADLPSIYYLLCKNPSLVKAKAKAPRTMQIFVRMDKTITINTHPSDTVLDIMNIIWDKEGVPPESQRLVFSGKRLWPNRTLSDCNIQCHSTIQFNFSFAGLSRRKRKGTIENNDGGGSKRNRAM